MFYEDQVKESQPEKQAAHTPGPWRVIDSGGSFGVQMGQVGGFFIDSKANAYANARLIAAAPELLEALKQVRFYCAVEGATGRASVALNADHAVFAQIDAALLKAEGREGR